MKKKITLNFSRKHNHHVAPLSLVQYVGAYVHCMLYYAFRKHEVLSLQAEASVVMLTEFSRQWSGCLTLPVLSHSGGRPPRNEAS